MAEITVSKNLRPHLREFSFDSPAYEQALFDNFPNVTDRDISCLEVRFSADMPNYRPTSNFAAKAPSYPLEGCYEPAKNRITVFPLNIAKNNDDVGQTCNDTLVHESFHFASITGYTNEQKLILEIERLRKNKPRPKNTVTPLIAGILGGLASTAVNEARNLSASTADFSIHALGAMAVTRLYGYYTSYTDKPDLSFVKLMNTEEQNATMFELRAYRQSIFKNIIEIELM